MHGDAGDSHTHLCERPRQSGNATRHFPITKLFDADIYPLFFFFVLQSTDLTTAVSTSRWTSGGNSDLSQYGPVSLFYPRDEAGLNAELMMAYGRPKSS